MHSRRVPIRDGKVVCGRDLDFYEIDRCKNCERYMVKVTRKNVFCKWWGVYKYGMAASKLFDPEL